MWESCKGHNLPREDALKLGFGPGFTYLSIAACLSSVLAASERRAVSVEDCVGLRKVASVRPGSDELEARISPDGQHLAYVLKSPNVLTNENDYQLLVRDLATGAQPQYGSVVFASTEEFGDLSWLSDGIKVAILVHPRSQHSKILFVSIDTRKVETIADIPEGIDNLSVNATGQIVAYTTYRKPSSSTLSPESVARGFHVPFRYSEILSNEKKGRSERYDVRVLRSTSDGKWEATSVRREGFDSVLAMTLSPDGNYLAFVYRLRETPPTWQGNRTVQALRKNLGINPYAAVIYDTRRRMLNEGLSFPYASEPIRWSSDSRSFALKAASPVGSKWEGTDARADVDPWLGYHLFAVDVGSLTVSEVLNTKAVAKGFEVVLWRNFGEIVIQRNDQKAFTRMERVGEGWKEIDRVLLPLEEDLGSIVTNDGQVIVGIRQGPTVPPDLFRFDMKTGNTSRLTELNPQIRGLTFGEVEKIEWTNSYGGQISGTLIKPVGYRTGQKYPLVIMLTWPTDEFVCDGHYSTAFPPQPLANDGFLVLIFNTYNIYSGGSKQPEGPPAIQEAESMVSSVEAGVDFLAGQGLADRNNVGIIGFSRSSWKVDYMLTHSNFRFRAASSADDGDYNYGMFWLGDGSRGAMMFQAGYGGPPYGETFQNWLKAAPALNAEKVRTPLLMEYTGEGGGNSTEPYTAYEFHTALNVLKKPVELFFYPNGSHPLDTPYERVASLQRNVDWFRFWMQGFEGKEPTYDPSQYVRWRELRNMAQEKQDQTE